MSALLIYALGGRAIPRDLVTFAMAVDVVALIIIGNLPGVAR